jgi:hypothetical protein
MKSIKSTSSKSKSPHPVVDPILNTLPVSSGHGKGAPKKTSRKPVHQESKYKYWCFTLNNYTDEDIFEINSLIEFNSNMNYLCYGKEIGESGTIHLQGYFELLKEGMSSGRGNIKIRLEVG